MPFGILDDLVNLFRLVAQVLERKRYTLVDDLEVSTTGQLLEFNESKIGLNTGSIAVHNQSNGAGRCNHGDLSIAESVLLAHLHGIITVFPR